ncbi:MAG: hypothetical protein EOP53_07835 [Sphingobacteriales bacterium]|nr:MAG: hypothetical protein EOP53_07835 [Sphingobacteriales bacterium]
MTKRVVIFLFVVLASFCAYSQKDTSYKNGDTLISKYYYKNGNISYLSKQIKGRDHYSFDHSFSYFKNGSPMFLTYYDYDSLHDTSYSYVGRRNGTPKRISISTKKVNQQTEYTRQGEAVRRTVNRFNGSYYIVYLKNHIGWDSTTVFFKETPQKHRSLDTVKYYGGLIGSNLGVVELNINGSIKYLVNSIEMNESEYKTFIAKYDSFMQRREPKHFYKEYTPDSVLVYEGVFKGVDLPCGQLTYYYPNGKVQVYEYFDKKGRKTYLWSYYREDGYFLGSEYYWKGVQQ